MPQEVHVVNNYFQIIDKPVQVTYLQASCYKGRVHVRISD